MRPSLIRLDTDFISSAWGIVVEVTAQIRVNHLRETRPD